MFSAWFCVCVSVIDRIDIGLDQSLSMPRVLINTASCVSNDLCFVYELVFNIAGVVRT